MSINVNKKLLRFLGDKFSEPILKVLCLTLKIVEKNKRPVEDLIQNNQNAVFAFWHGTMIVPWYLLKNFSPSTIISKSKDGKILTNILKKWGYSVLRGSSSNNGKEILDNLVVEAINKKNIAITPDGPRGPEKVMKAGAVIIAKKSNIPLILVGVGYGKKKILKSWDKFEVPYFFSKAIIVYSDPIFIDANLSYSETDEKIKAINVELQNIQLKATQNC
jgi:lysophospholipid acyltransferase (LPLAT)-like uncharacterized protein